MQGTGQDNSSTHRFVAYNATGQAWNGSAFETWVDGHFSTYAITATRLGTTANYYAADVAAAVRWELWYWTGTLSTSYPVYDSGPANVTRVNGVAATATTVRSVAVTQRNVQVVDN